jgi:hypothetical protein
MNLKETLKRVQIIYNECAPEAAENREAESLLDDFTKYKKIIHKDVKETRQVKKSCPAPLPTLRSTTTS